MHAQQMELNTKRHMIVAALGFGASAASDPHRCSANVYVSAIAFFFASFPITIHHLHRWKLIKFFVFSPAVNHNKYNIN